jgi:hypothetical protein
VRCNFAVIDGSLAAVRGVSATRVGPRPFVCRAPAIARRAIPCGSVELGGRVVARLGFPVTLLGGEVTRPRGQPRIFAILRGLRAVLGSKPAVVDRLGAVIRGLGAAQGGLSTFICHAPAITGGAVPCGSVEITRRVVARFGLAVTQPGRDITVLSGHPRLATAHACQFVRPGIGAILGSLGTVFGRHLAVVDGLGAVVRRPGAPPGGLVTFVCRVFPVGRGAIACGSIEIACRVITRFGLTVAQSGGDVSVRRSLARLPAAHSCQLVGPGIFTVLGGLGPIFRRNLAVIDRLGAVVRSLGAPGWRPGAFAFRLVTLCVIARCSLSVTLFRLSITYIGGQIAVAPFNVALACRGQGISVLIRQSILGWAHRHNNCSNLAGRVSDN